MSRFWGNRDFILGLALTLGLTLGQGTRYTEKLVLPALGLVMTLALLEISWETFRAWRRFIHPTLTCLVLNYLLLGGIIVGLGRWLVPEPSLRNGLVLVATVPPAIAVIPFTILLGGDQIFSLLGVIGAYLAALALTPLLTLMFLEGQLLVYPDRILLIVAELILGPLLISRLLRYLPLAPYLLPYKGRVTNWSFFFITYTIVGLNRDLFLRQPWELWPILAIATVSTFLWGTLIEFLARWRGVAPTRRVSLTLMGTLKNYGLAGGLALSLFDRKTAVPAAVSTVFMITYIIWLGIKARKGTQTTNAHH